MDQKHDLHKLHKVAIGLMALAVSCWYAKNYDHSPSGNNGEVMTEAGDTCVAPTGC